MEAYRHRKINFWGHRSVQKNCAYYILYFHSSPCISQVETSFQNFETSDFCGFSSYHFDIGSIVDLDGFLQIFITSSCWVMGYGFSVASQNQPVTDGEVGKPYPRQYYFHLSAISVQMAYMKLVQDMAQRDGL